MLSRPTTDRVQRGARRQGSKSRPHPPGLRPLAAAVPPASLLAWPSGRGPAFGGAGGLSLEVEPIMARQGGECRRLQGTEVSALLVANGKDGVGELDARGLDCDGIVAKVAGNALPGLIKRLKGNLEGLGSKGPAFDDLTCSHEVLRAKIRPRTGGQTWRGPWSVTPELSVS